MTVLFDSADAAAQTFLSDLLPFLQANYPLPVTPSASYIASKLAAAESELQRKLGTYLTPTRIFGGTLPTADDIAALDGMPYATESGYDMAPDFFSVGQWGTLALRSRPVQSIQSMKFIYPSLNAQVIDMPTSWIQLDQRAGVVNVVPGQGGLNIPLNIFAMQAMNVGVVVPNMIRVVYTAGIDKNHYLFPDIQDLCMRLIALRMLKDMFMPQSGSISADGLSQSQSVDVSKFGGLIDTDIDGIKTKLQGVVGVMGVLG